MNKNLNFLPREFSNSNIDKAISDYKDSISKIPLYIESNGIINFLNKLKRDKMETGPYPNVSLFEAANRIMTDLTILYGVKDILNGAILELDFDKYKVEFGNENKNNHDIEAKNNAGKSLIGEAFNVSESYFYTKKSSALKKLNKSTNKNKILLLLYNSDARSHQGKIKISDNEFHYPVEIKI